MTDPNEIIEVLVMRIVVVACASCLFIQSAAVAEEKPDDAAALKHAMEFCYPKTETGSNAGVGPAVVIPTSTTDDFQTVVEWYERKTGVQTTRQEDGKLALAGGHAGGGGGAADRPNEWYIVQQDSKQANGKPRPVQFCQFLRETKTHLLVVAITRADNEDETHIVVSYLMLAGE